MLLALNLLYIYIYHYDLTRVNGIRTPLPTTSGLLGASRLNVREHDVFIRTLFRVYVCVNRITEAATI